MLKYSLVCVHAVCGSYSCVLSSNPAYGADVSAVFATIITINLSITSYIITLGSDPGEAKGEKESPEREQK